MRTQSKSVRGEAGRLLECLEREGNRLKRPIADYVEDGIYELRIIVERQQHRILYFFHKKIIIATNAFLKKSGKIPKGQLSLAKKCRADWLKREEKEKQ